jgi:hypothetical protein
MLRRPSGPSEEQDASTTTEVLPAAPVHGDKGIDQLRGFGSDFGDTIRKREPSSDDALGRRPPQQTFCYPAASTTAASPLRTPHTAFRSLPMTPPAKDITPDTMVEAHGKRSSRLRNPWSCSLYTLVTALLGFAVLLVMIYSFMTRQLDTKGCEMCYMRPSFIRYPAFDTEHTRFASKYSLYLYREGAIDEDARVGRNMISACNWANQSVGQRRTSIVYPWECG